MPIHTAHGHPLGEWIADGKHRPFRASACPLRASQYDESQMKEADPDRREQRGALLYDC